MMSLLPLKTHVNLSKWSFLEFLSRYHCRVCSKLTSMCPYKCTYISLYTVFATYSISEIYGIYISIFQNKQDEKIKQALYNDYTEILHFPIKNSSD